MSFKTLVAFPTKTDLVAMLPTAPQPALLLGVTVAGDLTTPSYYVYDGASTLTDDGVNIITPTDAIGGPGRYILKKLISIPSSKRQESYSGTTNASGNYVVTFITSYSLAPNIQANIIGGSNTNLIKIVSVSTTGFTVNVVNRTDVLGLLPTYSNVTSAAIDVLITEK